MNNLPRNGGMSTSWPEQPTAATVPGTNASGRSSHNKWPQGHADAHDAVTSSTPVNHGILGMTTTTDPYTQVPNMSDATVPHVHVDVSIQRLGLTRSGDIERRIAHVVDRLGVPLCLLLFAIVRYIVPLILGYVLWHVA